jgi:hypothetical protein
MQEENVRIKYLKSLLSYGSIIPFKSRENDLDALAVEFINQGANTCSTTWKTSKVIFFIAAITSEIRKRRPNLIRHACVCVTRICSPFWLKIVLLTTIESIAP